MSGVPLSLPESSHNGSANTSSKTSTLGKVIQRGDGLQVVVGLGASGMSAVKYLVKQGYPVAVTDGGQPKLASELTEHVKTYFGAIDGELLQAASRIIISPGIDPYLSIFEPVRQRHIPIVSDVQVFHEICQQRHIPIVAITGSNAKSTVTTLVGQMALDAGKKAGIGGNLGTPALDLLSDDLEVAVLELSSFQLQTISNLQAQVATVLNMSPDHLDRHGDMLGYHQAKHRIFQGAKSIVINRDDPLSRPLVPDDTPRISFGSRAPDRHQYGLLTEGNGDIWLARGRDKLLHESQLAIKGEHNLLNALAALALGELIQLPMATMLTTLQQFKGLPHRCEYVATVAGIDCFDDSKGTNIGSTLAAIEGLGKVYAPKHKKLAVILGGLGKGQDFSSLAKSLLKYTSHVYLIGADADKIAADLCKAGGQTFADGVSLKFCEMLDNAVTQAWHDGKASAELGVLLLSPACASFDQFSGYVARGEHFTQLVKSAQLLATN